MGSMWPAKLTAEMSGSSQETFAKLGKTGSRNLRKNGPVKDQLGGWKADRYYARHPGTI